MLASTPRGWVAVPQSTHVAHLYLAWTRFPSPQHACAHALASPRKRLSAGWDMRARTLWPAVGRSPEPTRKSMRTGTSLAQGLTVGLVVVSLLGEYLHTHSNPQPTAHPPSLGSTGAGALRPSRKKGNNPPPPSFGYGQECLPSKALARAHSCPYTAL